MEKTDNYELQESGILLSLEKEFAPSEGGNSFL